ncbi:tol-pal system YbgF family protein [Bacteroidota bacterium]
MAKKKKQIIKDQNLEVVENVLSRTEQWIEDNQKNLTYVLIGIVIIVGGFLGYKKLYKLPIEKEAQSQMFVAENYFKKDSFNLALNGDGNYPGFLDIIDDYGSTKSGNLAKYYAGTCFLRTGDFESSIEYLKDYNIKEKLIGNLSLGMIGDAYCELGDNDNAINYYLDAANRSENIFTSPMYLFKAAVIYEEIGNYQDALDLYEKIEKDYSDSNEGRNIAKYIARVKDKI